MQPSPEAVLKIIEEFIIREKGRLSEPLSLDTPLLQRGLIDSFAVVSLGEEFGNAFGIALTSGSLIAEDFETPRLLYNRLKDLATG
jgi:acyl carrier protein